MNAWVIASGLVVPAVSWLAYMYYRDRDQPEPLWAIAVAYVLGIGSAVLCLQGYRVVDALGAPDDPIALASSDLLSFLVYCLVVIGGVEELFKLLPFIIICTRLRAFDETLDGIVYASAVALGFASYENLLFLEFLDGIELYGRAFASPLVHTLFASVWGFTIARARMRRRSIIVPALVGLVIAALLHGLYDFFVMGVHPLFRPLPALLVLVLWIWRMVTIAKLRKSAPE